MKHGRFLDSSRIGSCCTLEVAARLAAIDCPLQGCNYCVFLGQVFEGIQETYSSYFMDPAGAGEIGDEPIRTEHTPAVKSFQLGVETPMLGAIPSECLFGAFK